MCDHHFTRRQFVRGASTAAASLYLFGCRSPEAAVAPSAATPSDEPPPSASDWDALADLALKRIRAAGAEYGDIRLIDTTVQSVSGQDRRIAGVRDQRDRGFGVRVLYKGAWGFASSSVMSGGDVRRTADLAAEIARSSAALVSEPVKLAEEPPHRDRVETPRRVDPLAVSLEEKSRLLSEVMERLHAQDGISRSNASLWTQRDVKLFASTEGALIRSDLLATHGGFGATAVHEDRFASRGFETPYLRSGYELVLEAGFLSQAARVAAEAVEKVRAPRVEPGVYDLVLDPEHLALTIHESCGHPTELDRALGYEANYAGTSFLTPDKLGTFRYGSPHVNLVADNVEPGTLAATGYDDDGVAAQRWHIIREGIFCGYSTNREVAGKIGETRSRGSNRADSWASIPIVRISNVGLAPGNGRLDDMITDVKRGIYIEGHDSFSIDQKRYNFQFGGDVFWLIENGKRTHMLRDVIYTGITPEFWGSCDAVADASHRKRYGFISCGKGQPGQSGWMTHAAAHARFRRVNVICGQTSG
ncbi:MAG: Metalloprotease TldD [Phycisphaerae bacterium]|nr:Metalloprotease TldD [Phycisphaerae bacterium]